MRKGAQLGGGRNRLANLQQFLQQSTGRIFVSFENQTTNTADIVGIFSAETMGELAMRKNGKWQCSFSKWHERGDDGNCPDQKLKAMYEDRRKIMKVCQGYLGQDRKGLIKVEGKQTYDRCDCNVPILSKLTNGNSAMAYVTGFIR